MFSLKKPITRRPIRWLTKTLASGNEQYRQTLSDLKLVAAHPRFTSPELIPPSMNTCRPKPLPGNSRTPSGVCNKRKPSARPAMMSSENSSEIHSGSSPGSPGYYRTGQKYGPIRLENACLRAMHFNNIRYRSVKNILSQGLDQLPLNHELFSVPPLSSAYTTGRFLRCAGNIHEERGYPYESQSRIDSHAQTIALVRHSGFHRTPKPSGDRR